MMMSKPAPTTQQEAAVKPAVKKSPQDSIADLERRLAQLAPIVPTTTTSDQEPPAFAAPPPESAAATEAPEGAAAAAPVKGGKNALLARIMAAQERAKQAQQPAFAAPKEETPPPYSEDLLFMENSKPPEFDSMLLPPPDQQPPPPAFDDALLPPLEEPPTAASVPTFLWDPHAPQISAPPAPSAPAFEDLLDEPQPSKFVIPPPPPPTMEQEAIEAILGMEGLSDAEKQQLIEEQKQILAAIEADRANTQVSVAAARADAFEQRSTSAAIQAVSRDTVINSNGQVRPRSVHIGNDRNIPLHGVELTKRAIEDGTAITVKCLACDNWMQVTKAATLMFCPVCQTVSPVVIPDSSSDAEAAKQVDADLELAEKLQQEEYQKAARDEQRRAAKAGAAPAAAAPKQDEASGQGWMEWLGLATPSTTTSTSPERPATFSQAPVERGYIGVSLPPGASVKTSPSSSSPSTRLAGKNADRLLAAQTETISFEEDDSLLGGRARVAEQKPLFSCVADSITSAASSLYATTLTEDAEGNIHGVDSSSLLAVPNIRRGNEEQK